MDGGVLVVVDGFEVDLELFMQCSQCAHVAMMTHHVDDLSVELVVDDMLFVDSFVLLCQQCDERFEVAVLDGLVEVLDIRVEWWLHSKHAHWHLLSWCGLL